MGLAAAMSLPRALPTDPLDKCVLACAKHRCDKNPSSLPWAWYTGVSPRRGRQDRKAWPFLGAGCGVAMGLIPQGLQPLTKAYHAVTITLLGWER